MREHMWRATGVACVLALSASTAWAGSLEGTSTITLSGNDYTLKTWVVGDDLDGINPDYELQPEGMTFRPGNGTLYVAGDRDDDETDGHLVVDVPGASGDLSTPTAILMADRPDDLGKKVGPEGLAINTSGAGYGAGLSDVVFSETKRTEIAGVTDVAGGPPAPVSDLVNTSFEWDGLCYVSSLDMFCAIEEHSGDISKAQYYTHTATTLSPFGDPFVVSDQGKGVTALDGYIASGLLGMEITDDQVLAVAAKPASVAVGNRLGLFATDGTPLGEFDLDPYVAEFAEIECIAVDEDSKILYLGDEETGRIYAIHDVPEPTTLALAAFGALGMLAGRRRR